MALLLSWAAPIGPIAEQFLWRLGQPRVGDGTPTYPRKDFLFPAAFPEAVPLRRPLLYAEAEMEIIHGRIREILPAIDGTMCGFVIDGGLEVHFAADRARQISALISVGSQLEICGNSYRGPSGDPRLDAQFITNLDLRRFVNLDDSLPEQSPEVPSMCSPTEARAALLAPPEGGKNNNDSENSLHLRHSVRELSVESRQNPRLPGNFASRPPSVAPSGSSVRRVRADKDAAARSIELAYDSLHRSQALLAYIKIVDLQTPDLSQLFNESKYTYQQAISNYQKQEYAVANEFAAASGELSRSVELLVSRTLRADSSYPTLVPYPPGNQTGVPSPSEAEGSLTRVASLLNRIHWLVRNGTLPSEDRNQVRRIASWSDIFYAEGRESLQTGSIGEASYLIDAAEAVAHSAEHVCKQNYITHASPAD